LSGTGPFLGLERYASYENCVLPFGPGDTILAYTEGVTEAQSATSQELFGTSRIIHCLRRSQRSRESPCAALVNELDTFTGSCYRNDITIATIEACITLPIGELGACLPAVPARTCVAELNTSDGARKAPSGALTAT
jgi:hypothetical protein